MNKNVKILIGILSYLSLAVFQAYVAEKRLAKLYYQNEFVAAGLVIFFEQLLIMLFSLGFLFQQRETENISVSYILRYQLMASAVLWVLAQLCMMLLGVELSFLFQLMLESSNILGKLPSYLLFRAPTIQKRDSVLSIMYGTSILFFIILSRGPFCYYIYFLVCGWISFTFLAQHIESTGKLVSNETRSADILTKSIWSLLFSLGIVIFRNEIGPLTTANHIGDCFMVGLLQAMTTLTLLYFFKNMSSTGLGALIRLNKIVRLMWLIFVFYRRLSFWHLIIAGLTICSTFTEIAVKALSTPKIDVFDHKKEKAQTTYSSTRNKRFQY